MPKTPHSSCNLLSVISVKFATLALQRSASAGLQLTSLCLTFQLQSVGHLFITLYKNERASGIIGNGALFGFDIGEGTNNLMKMILMALVAVLLFSVVGFKYPSSSGSP